MPTDKEIWTISKFQLEQYAAAQSGVNPDYDPKDQFGMYARVIEKQSAEFLEDYLSGEVELEKDAQEAMSDYLELLSHSKYDRIRKSLKKAKDKYKIQAILRHKDEEKKDAFVKSRFKVLFNKKEATALSSKDMLMISKLLETDLGYSTKKLKDRLRSFAESKIAKTLNGEMKADDDFIRLVKALGNNRQRQTVMRRIENERPISTAKAATPEKAAQEKKQKHSSASEQKTKKAPKKNEKTEKKAKKGGWLTSLKNRFKSVKEKAYKTTKRVLVTAGLAAIAWFGGKSVLNSIDKGDNDKKQDKTELTQNTPVKEQKVSQNNEQTPQKTTVDFAEEMARLNKAYKDRFDSSLKILLGEDARDKLYQEIDALVQQGKIEFSDGTTREWYAHAFTMYDKLSPNSKENQEIKNLRSGGDVDKGYINSLVLAAKRDGSGISASGTYSAFDNASKEEQQSHIQKRKAVKNAEAALAAAKAQKQSR